MQGIFSENSRKTSSKFATQIPMRQGRKESSSKILGKRCFP